MHISFAKRGGLFVSIIGMTYICVVNKLIMQAYGKNIYQSLYFIDAKHHAGGRM